ncbi:hypothetical protein [Pontibacter sp. G13]|uniref:hypothetical protein n=1 Tax=Pontibacter sp. G13 TaxID=3074898 RepID=UPI0028898797|nr:hypothetical protein [Pontibacter sp. G13]WNJ18280.1 hypothetical protein RJD25_25795 [Pontibacter sp. G13]
MKIPMLENQYLPYFSSPRPISIPDALMIPFCAAIIGIIILGALKARMNVHYFRTGMVFLVIVACWLGEAIFASGYSQWYMNYFEMTQREVLPGIAYSRGLQAAAHEVIQHPRWGGLASLVLGITVAAIGSAFALIISIVHERSRAILESEDQRKSI